jgi:DNA-binding GntR family transcriptional regulator
MEEVKTKNDLIKEAQELADKYAIKKEVIETALNDLDSKEKITEEHIGGMAVIEQLFNELDEIEVEQLSIFEKIKKL